MKRLLVLLCFLSILIPSQSLLASHPTSILVESLDARISFSLAGMNDVSGASLAVSDLGDDGVSEIIVGNGMGYEPRVRVLRQDGSEIGSFLAYAPTLGVGINVTTCDLTGDGHDEIIVAPQRGGGPHVRVFNRFGTAIDDGGFFAYDKSMREGVNLACGDLTGDARAELVTLPAPGGGPHVRVWSWDGNEMLIENFFAFHNSDRSGLVGIVNDKTLFLAQQFTHTPTIKELVIHTSVQTLNEKKIIIDGLGVQSLAIMNGELFLSTSSSSTLYNITTSTSSLIQFQHATLATYNDSLVMAPGRVMFSSSTQDTHIEIDTSQQRLYAFEHGILRNSFLISSGRWNTTPLGTHSVLAKVPLVHYAWNYGEGNQNNYDLGWVPYNLRFYPHIYIHYAPWHNNFGHQMSHGCVNVGLNNMQWIYEWAQEDISVVVR